MSEAIASQITKADLLVLTKTDLIGEDQRHDVDVRLHELAPETPVFVAGADDPALGRFLALGGRRPDGVAATAAPTLFDAHTVETLPFGPFTTRVDVEVELAATLERVPGTVMRAKGIVATADDQLHLIQVVGRRHEITPLPMSEFAAPTPLTVISLT